MKKSRRQDITDKSLHISANQEEIIISASQLLLRQQKIMELELLNPYLYFIILILF